MFYRSSDDTTALHVAATYGRVDAIKLLLANGANITLTDEVLWLADIRPFVGQVSSALSEEKHT